MTYFYESNTGIGELEATKDKIAIEKALELKPNLAVIYRQSKSRLPGRVPVIVYERPASAAPKRRSRKPATAKSI